MKFAHIADCHIGSWREPKISQLNLQAYVKAVESCIEQKVDFVLISGDLFNTSLPAIDKLKAVVKMLKKLKDNDIPVYCIAGSHDFSPSGKTMIDVLESAGLCANVAKGRVDDGKLFLKFTLDQKTGAKITGMVGRKGMIERNYYEDLDRGSLEQEQGFKIFLFHTAISELKPKELEKMDSAPLSLLPRGFDYYAGGHLHIMLQQSLDGYPAIVYPGPLFPNNFKELEEQQSGFFIFDDGKIIHQPLHVINVIPLKIDCSGKTPEQIEHDILTVLKNNEFYETIVTLRLEGTMTGKATEINFRNIFESFYEKGAYFVMKNTLALLTQEFNEIKVSHGESTEELERKLIKEHLGQIKGVQPDKEEEIIIKLISALSQEKQEGERAQDFFERVRRDADAVLMG